MGAFSDYLEQALLNHVLRGDSDDTAFEQPLEIWISLHDDHPDGDGNHEIGGGSYERQRVIFSEPSGNLVINDNDVEFEDLPEVTIRWIGLWDAEAGGNFLYQGELGTPRQASSGDNLTFNAGGFGVRHD